MRVIVLIDSLFTGGAEFSTLLFYQWLVENKHANVQLVCLYKAEPSYDPSSFGFEEPVYLPAGKYKQYKAMKILVDDYQPDIIHSVLFKANILGRFIRIFKRGFKHIESLVNETYSDYRLKDPNVNRLKLEAYRAFDFLTQLKGVDHYHSNGNSVAIHYQDKLLVSKNRITQISRGRAENKFLKNHEAQSKIKKEFGLHNKLVFINVGRHEYQKGQDVLLKALYELDQSLLNKIKVLIVGREGNFTKNLNKIVRDYKLEKTVIFTGHRTDVNLLLASSDVFIFPSRFEGLPGALIEAEAAALSIIASDIPNNLEVIEEGKNALIFQVNDYLNLKEKIGQLLTNQEQLQKMSENSLKLFHKRFRIDSVHVKMYEMLKNQLDSEKPRSWN